MRCFDRCNFKRLVFPNSLRVIYSRVGQYCNNLEYVELNPGLQYLGLLSFTDCKNLREIKINNTIPVAFSEYVFSGCNIEKIHLARGLKDNPQIQRLISELQKPLDRPIDVILF